MPQTREIRIHSNGPEAGKVVDADRDVFVTVRKGKGGPDKVKWVQYPLNGGETYIVVFGAGSGDPFAAKTVTVPNTAAGSGNAEEIKGLPGTYKYIVVRDSDGEVTDDPNIIIKS
ncbi:MAG TPA: hypothetical protein VM818_21730 [Vicinamibacterales bacterium]|jgi:hypothetical protein|nr:hypothetical protein [Vicinamibacterales bacterium]